MTSIPRQAIEILRRDLRRELRTGEVLWVTIPFGAIALLLIPLAVGTDIPLLRSLGPGIYWVVVLLFGVLVAMRRSGADNQAQRDFLALSGLDPAARFVGQATANALLLLGFELVLGVVSIALYDSSLTGWPWLLLILPIAAAGLALLGTLAAHIVESLGGATALVPLLVAPLSVPLLLGATQSMEALRLGRSILGWLLVMLIVMLTLAIAGILTARPLQEAQ
ncbi:MAG: ABC transporter permease [Acidimicrobiia bacterium]|nr:heme exporter protein CcmB [Acidimicrobiia bacterium]NNF63729.1 ABC transporter permease [Acidimicrobiia bacterium]